MASLTPHEDESRARTPEEDECGFYSKKRYAYILDLFREGQDRDLALKAPKTPFSTSTYDLRRRVFTYAHFAGSCDDKSSSEEEYDPATENRRRPTKNTGRPSGSQRSPRVRTHDEAGIAGDAGGLSKRQKIVPLKFRAESSKEFLRNLRSQQIPSGRSKNSCQIDDIGHLVTPQAPHDQLTGLRVEPQDSYLWKLDEESAGIDNANGRALRSRTIPDQEIEHEKGANCASCIAAKKKCTLKTGHPCARFQNQNVECVKWTGNLGVEPSPTIEAEFTAPRMVEAASLSSQTSTSIPIVADDTMQIDTELLIPPRRSSVLDSQQAEPSAPLNIESSSGASRLPTGTSVNPVVLDSPPDSPILSASRDSVRDLVTYWAHPMNFKHAKSAGPCDFCNDFRFGIFGHGRITAEVVQYPGSTELEETGNGHRSNGKDATRMCVICALQRIHISRCTVHDFRTLRIQPDAHPPTLYLQQLHAEVRDPPIANTAYLTCKLCPGLAVWRCCVDKEYDLVGKPLVDGQGRGKGCGLRLCNACKVLVQGFGGVLEKERIMTAYGQGVRADVEFLFKDSLLHQAYCKSHTSCFELLD